MHREPLFTRCNASCTVSRSSRKALDYTSRREVAQRPARMGARAFRQRAPSACEISRLRTRTGFRPASCSARAFAASGLCSFSLVRNRRSVCDATLRESRFEGMNVSVRESIFRRLVSLAPFPSASIFLLEFELITICALLCRECPPLIISL